MKTEFRAYSERHGYCIGESPRDAALKFFEKYPNARKCEIIEGKSDGRLFTVIYGKASEFDWPDYYKNVTRKTVMALPGTDGGQ